MHDLEDAAAALQDFVAKVPTVTSAQELERLLGERIGVDSACPCARGRDALARQLGGLRMDPGHFAQCLWGIRGLVAGARAFLHIGTHHGHSFVALSEFLRHHADPRISMHTVDERNFVLTDALPYVLPHRMFRPTSSLRGRHYDFVFIESGDPEDYRHVGQHARVCAWHCPGRGAVEVAPCQRVHTTYGDIVVLTHVGA